MEKRGDINPEYTPPLEKSAEALDKRGPNARVADRTREALLARAPSRARVEAVMKRLPPSDEWLSDTYDASDKR